MKPSKKPVFYDERRRRRKILLRILSILGILGVFVTAILIISVLLKPVLPLPKEFKNLNQSRTLHTAKSIQREIRSTSGGLALGLPKEKPITDAINMSGFYVEWDDTSYASLKENSGKISTLTPEELGFSATGDIILRSPEKFQRTLDYIRANREKLQVLPLVSNFDSNTNLWDSSLLQKVLSSTGSRQILIDKLAEFADQKNLDGINVDFEEILPETLPWYYQFLDELGKRLHEDKRLLQADVPVNTDGFDYRRVSNWADSIVLMAYDEHWLTGSPGSIAGIGWFKDNIAQIAKEVPVTKLTVAIGNYGYDWTKEKKGSAETVTFQEAQTLAKESEWDIEFDQTSYNPHFSYEDEDGKDHEVWYLDAVTAYNQISVARDLWIDNFSLWRMGSEDPSFWKLFEGTHFEDDEEPEELKSFASGYEIDYRWAGEFYRVTDTPKDGNRSIVFDNGYVTNEKIQSFAEPYVISRYWTKDSKKIALTFDDGPDPDYTPKILDILRENDIKAAFFVVGQEAQANPEILKRIVDEWHLVGSHTYTHPDISKIGENRLELELNLTQRLIESLTGRSTILFRPPYGEDIEPETPDQVPALERSNLLGYITVGMKIDPNDWKSPPPETIVREVVDQIHEKRWNVVLLHDSGGDRNATIAALPEIITSLKKEGYSFVGLDELVGQSRDNLMPRIGKSESVFTMDDSVFFNMIHALSWIVYAVFFLYLVTGIFRLVIVLGFAFVQKSHVKKRKFDPVFLPKIAIIVPAYNEEKVILRTIESVLKTKYSWPFEVIVVDDGSKDWTFQTVVSKYSQHRSVRAFTKENGGKGEAINFAMAQTDATVVIVIDADTLFDDSTIPSLVRHFADPDIGAVSGNVKVGNRNNFITRLQAYEYVCGQNLDRRAYDAMNTITVVPGAIGAWRRDAVLAAGGFSSETIAEDSDLTISLLRSNWKIVHENAAHAYTEAPEDWKTFGKQRFRWTFGILQVAFKHADVVFDKKASFALRFFVLPHTLLSQTVFPAVAPIADVATLFTLGLVLLGHFFPGIVPFTGWLWHILAYVAVFIVLDFLTSFIVFAIDRDEDWKLLPYAPLQRLCYRFFMHAVYIRSLRTALSGKLATGRLVGWDTFDRSANVKIESNP